ncbi:cytochrome P450 2F2-like [Conger conger]|uniref:cytochrome P450 2F2-like n=1 Tax=Conger conger TaxID=82655 RepID=UPI002A5AD9B2|nr:cytochrome P450 2F2-like [Conger conger]
MLASLILLWVFFSLLFFLFREQRPKNFPPGPRLIPIFGSTLHLNLINPLNDFRKLSERYGNVYSVYFGSFPVVVLNGLQAVKEGLVTHSAESSGRPRGFLINQMTENKGVVLNDGPVWKMQRRFALMTLRNFGMGKNSMQARILKETSYITSYLEKNAGKTIHPQTLFHNATCNIICSVLYGTRLTYDDKFLQLIVRCITQNNKILNCRWTLIYDSFPMLRFLPMPCLKAIENYNTLKEGAVAQISQHKKSWVPGKPRDFLDCYLDEMEKRGDDKFSFSESQLAILLLDFSMGGTDTTANTFLTAFLYLMTHPDVQERCQKEIDEVLGEKEQVSFEDRHTMPYTQAVIHEVQRVADTVPLSIFHAITKDTRMMGYDIPKGTMIIPNLSSVLRDESQWKFPHEFNPSNFLNNEGEFVKPEAFIPFSAGPRLCPGEALTRMELFLILVTLLRRFKFIWPEDAGVPDYKPIFGFTHTPKPYRMVVRLRADH